MSRRTDEIESHIQEVNERMALRINNLSRELDARVLAARFTGKPNPGVGDVLDSAISIARDNPIPMAMIGLGVAGLLGAGAFGMGGREMTERTRAKAGEYRASAATAASNLSRSVQETAEARMGDAAEAIESVCQSATDMAGNIRDYAEDTMREGTRRATQAADSAARTARRQSAAASEWVRENPVACGLIVMAAGAAIASFLTAKSPRHHAEVSPEEAEAASKLFKAHARERELQERKVSRTPDREREVFETLAGAANEGKADVLGSTQRLRPASARSSGANPSAPTAVAGVSSASGSVHAGAGSTGSADETDVDRPGTSSAWAAASKGDGAKTRARPALADASPTAARAKQVEGGTISH